MINKAILFSSFLLVSVPALAEESLLEGLAKQVAKQAAKDAATAAAPEAAEKAKAASQLLENAQTLKEGVENAPDALKGQAKKLALDSVKQRIGRATPEEFHKVVDALNAGKETEKNLKEKIGAAPKSTQEIKSKAKEKVIGKALDLLN